MCHIKKIEIMTIDYSTLLNKDSAEYFNTWHDIYDENLSLPDNFLNILKRSIYLPYDHYKLITAYAFIPSVLARVVPYLFLYGISGTGKSTIGKLIAHLHGIEINSSSDTFASIRNSLENRRKAWIQVPSDNPAFPDGYNKEVEVNTCMVWDDIDSKVFTVNRDIYRLFKFGYDKTSDKIEISSIETGKNLVFHCFCPKIFSSIFPLHLDDNLKELRRRLIVIPTKRIEDIDDERLNSLNVDRAFWANNLIDVSHYSWKGFSQLYREFWSLEMANLYLSSRKILEKQALPLTSQQRIISIDLLTTGVVIGIWNDENEGINDLLAYWQWFKDEIQISTEPLNLLLKRLIDTEVKNARLNGEESHISNVQIKAYCESWYNQGQLLEKPTAKTIRQIMSELGYRLIVGGRWIKA